MDYSRLIRARKVVVHYLRLSEIWGGAGMQKKTSTSTPNMSQAGAKSTTCSN